MVDRFITATYGRSPEGTRNKFTAVVDPRDFGRIVPPPTQREQQGTAPKAASAAHSDKPASERDNVPHLGV